MSIDELEAPFRAFGDVTSARLSKIQALVGSIMARNAASIPHVTHHDEVDVTALEDYRRVRSEELGVKLTPLAFLMKAVVGALKSYPRFNSSLAADGQTLVTKLYFNVGIAIDVPSGLLVAVLKDCDRKPVADLATEIFAISEKARAKGLSVAEMSGGSITISSLGGIGGTGFTPIINAPEVAIIGVTRTKTKPVWDGTAFVPRKLMPISLSYDHRIINGADAARFVCRLGELLATPERLQ